MTDTAVQFEKEVPGCLESQICICGAPKEALTTHCNDECRLKNPQIACSTPGCNNRYRPTGPYDPFCEKCKADLEAQRKRDLRANPPAPPEPKAVQCACGRSFVPYDGRDKYCHISTCDEDRKRRSAVTCVCGRTFVPRDGRDRYCNQGTCKEDRAKLKAKPKEELPERKCECGRTFTPKDRRDKFCHIDNCDSDRAAGKSLALPQRVCLNPACKKEFHPWTKTQRCCSPPCEFTITHPARKCIVCGTEFIPWEMDQVTCRPNCEAPHA